MAMTTVSRTPASEGRPSEAPPSPRRRSRTTASERRAGWGFIAPSTLVLLALVLYPLLFGFFISAFKTNLRTMWDFVGLKFFFQSLSNPDFLHSLGITVLFAVLVVAGNLVVGTFLAILLNGNIRFRLLFRAILILPWLFPDVVVAIIFKWIYDPLYGLFNYFLTTVGIIHQPIAWFDDPNLAFTAVVLSCIWKGYPLVMILVLAGLQSIPGERYEAASLDGAAVLQKFRYVTLPGLIPVLGVSVILDFVWWFKHFTIVWLMTAGGPVNATKVVSIDIYRVAFTNFDFGRAAAMAVIVFLICLLVGIFYRRFSRDDQD
jgi:multiple sugar transport system permease protein